MLTLEQIAEIRAAADRHRRKQETSATAPAPADYDGAAWLRRDGWTPAEYWRHIAERHRAGCLFCAAGECGTYNDYLRLSMKVLGPFQPVIRGGNN